MEPKIDPIFQATHTSADIYTKSPVNKFKRILLFLIGIVLFVGSTFAGYEIGRYKIRKGKNQVQKTTLNTNINKSANTKTFSVGQVAAFLSPRNINEKPTSVKISFFDFQTKKVINTPANLNIKPGNSVFLGLWSPNGRYLPIQIQPVRDECNECKYETYLYDANTNSAKLIYSFDKNKIQDGPIWADTFLFAFPWLDDHTILLEGDNFYKSLSILSLDGTISTMSSTTINNNWVKNQDIFFTQILSRTGSISSAENIKIKGKNFPYIVEGTPIGLFSGNLLTFNKPSQEIYIGFCDYGCEEMIKFMEQIQSKGLKGDEQEVFDTINKPNLDVINVYQLTNGQLNKSIPIPSSKWTTVSVQFADNKIIALQVNRSLQPDKKRFLVSNDFQNFLVIFEDKLSEADARFMVEAVNRPQFYLSPDSKYILNINGLDVNPTNSEGYRVIAKNIDEGNEFVVCDNCASLRVFNPWTFSEAYKLD